MNGIPIRPANSEDADWGATLMAHADPWIKLGTTHEQLLKTFRHAEYHIFIAEADGLRAGVIVVHPRGLASSPYIKLIAVESNHQGRGVGESLMHFAETRFGKESDHLFLCVSSFNLRAQKFYKRLGYETVGELRDYVIEGESELLMHKRLR